MSTGATLAGARAFLLLIFLLTVTEASAYPVIRVYHDGWCLISQLVEAKNLTVKVRLLGEPEMIMVTDRTGPLEYNLSNGYLVVESFSGEVNITYETQTLTSKVGKVWTLTVNESIGPVEVRLPRKVWIVGMSDLPLEIHDSEEGLVLIMESPFKLDYVVVERPSSDGFPIYLLIPIVVAIVPLAWALKGGVKVNLDELDLSILSSLEYGEKSASELRKELEVPKSTVWRRLNRLESEGLIRIKRMDQGSLVRITRKGRRVLSSTR